MATRIQMQHETTGLTKSGFIGFSWTTLFFGVLPALFRGDFITFIGGFAVYAILGLMTFGVGGIIAGFVWAFFYNGYYTKRLLERGYRFADTTANNQMAAGRLGIRGSLPVLAS